MVPATPAFLSEHLCPLGRTPPTAGRAGCLARTPCRGGAAPVPSLGTAQGVSGALTHMYLPLQTQKGEN